MNEKIVSVSQRLKEDNTLLSRFPEFVAFRTKKNTVVPTSARQERGRLGNAFVRGDVDLATDDAWWMGREQTDLRILLAKDDGNVLMSAWWARAGTTGLTSHHETDGQIMPVRLLID